MIKALPFIIIAICAFGSGLIFQAKVLTPKIVIPKAPDCICPPAVAIDLQSFDVNKIKKVQTFTYAPSITGNITVVVDTSTYSKMIKRK